MARLRDIIGPKLKYANQSITTGKKWLSGADMAVEVTENRDKYMGG